jgi:hypothetical protein
MYVALRETFDVYPDSKAVRRFAGERLETFADWPVQNQMAALNARIVREVPDGDINHERLFKREHRSEVEAAKTRARDMVAAKSEPVVLAAEPRSVVTTPAADAAIEMVEPEPYGCDLCSYVGGSARGLAIHKGSAHKS